MFETQILPVVQRYARKVFGQDDEKASKALVLAWWYWSQSQKELPPSVWAIVAVRAVRNGRDLPGLKSRFRDVWDHRTNLQGAGMGEVVDRRPGPEELVMSQEEYEYLKENLNDVQRALVDMVENDVAISGMELAARLGKSPGRITQIRLEIKSIWEE